MRKLLGVLAIVTSLFAGAAAQGAVAARVYLDTQGMPRCFADPRGELPSQYLSWNKKDRYQRDVYSIAFTDESCEEAVRRDDAPTPRNSIKTLVKPEQNVLGGFLLSPRTRSALDQVRRGGNFFHSEPTGEAFLRTHPIPTFNIPLNRVLANRYGIGFTAEIYKAIVESHPQNRRFKRELLTNAGHFTNPTQGALRDRYHGRRVIYVAGMGHELSTYKRYLPLEATIQGLGLKMVKPPSMSFDTVEKNAEIIRNTIEQTLDQGYNVILVTLSKGAPETFLALGQLRPRSATEAHVEADLNFSGLVDGAFIVDWAVRFPQWVFVRPVLQKEFVGEGHAVSDFRGFKELSYGKMERLAAGFAFPPETSFVNIIGIIPGNGLASAFDVRSIQDKYVRPHISKFGANDGFAEYPSTEVPASAAPHVYSVVVDSSHAIVDGTFQGRPLDNDGARWQLVGALFQTLADELDRNAHN